MRKKHVIILVTFLTVIVLPLSGQRHNLNIPDIPGYITLKCDFHVHTVFSDGVVWPTVRIDEAYRDGLDVIALSDHIEYTPHKNYLPVNLNAAWEITQKAALEKNLLLVHAAEITRKMPPGHLNALFIQDAAPLSDPDFMKVIEEAVRQGAFIQYNHPGWRSQEADGIPKLYPAHQELIAKGWLNGIEYFNDVEYYPLVLDMCRTYGLAVMGNSDIHDPVVERYNENSAYARRPVTLVFARERTVESLREALFAGRTAVWYGDYLAGFSEYTGPLFYRSLTVSKPFKSDEKHIWFEIRNNSEIPFMLVHGPQGAPQELTIPANSSVVVRASVIYTNETLKYDVNNIITGNNEVLNVEIKVPAE